MIINTLSHISVKEPVIFEICLLLFAISCSPSFVLFSIGIISAVFQSVGNTDETNEMSIIEVIVGIIERREYLIMRMSIS